MNTTTPNIQKVGSEMESPIETLRHYCGLFLMESPNKQIMWFALMVLTQIWLKQNLAYPQTVSINSARRLLHFSHS